MRDGYDTWQMLDLIRGLHSETSVLWTTISAVVLLAVTVHHQRLWSFMKQFAVTLSEWWNQITLVHLVRVGGLVALIMGVYGIVASHGWISDAMRRLIPVLLLSPIAASFLGPTPPDLDELTRMSPPWKIVLKLIIVVTMEETLFRFQFVQWMDSTGWLSLPSTQRLSAILFGLAHFVNHDQVSIASSLHVLVTMYIGTVLNGAYPHSFGSAILLHLWYNISLAALHHALSEWPWFVSLTTRWWQKCDTNNEGPTCSFFERSRNEEIDGLQSKSNVFSFPLTRCNIPMSLDSTGRIRRHSETQLRPITSYSHYPDIHDYTDFHPISRLSSSSALLVGGDQKSL